MANHRKLIVRMSINVNIDKWGIVVVGFTWGMSLIVILSGALHLIRERIKEEAHVKQIRIERGDRDLKYLKDLGTFTNEEFEKRIENDRKHSD